MIFSKKKLSDLQKALKVMHDYKELMVNFSVKDADPTLQVHPSALKDIYNTARYCATTVHVEYGVVVIDVWVDGVCYYAQGSEDVMLHFIEKMNLTERYAIALQNAGAV